MKISEKLKKHLETGYFGQLEIEIENKDSGSFGSELTYIRWNDQKEIWEADENDPWEDRGHDYWSTSPINEEHYNLLLRRYHLTREQVPLEQLKKTSPNELLQIALKSFDSETPRLSEENLEKLLARNQFSDIFYAANFSPDSWRGIFKIMKRLEGIQKDGSESFAFDPRTKSPVIFSPKRMKRPNHYNEKKRCPICEGDTTPIIHRKRLGLDLYSFVNLNLFSFLNPDGTPNSRDKDELLRGINLLVWPTTQHKDIHQISYDDNVVCMEVLADLEWLLQRSADRNIFPLTQGRDESISDNYRYGYVQIIKNTGRLVGGSIEHGHYQVGFLNTIPRKIEEDVDFLNRRGVSFAEYMLNENPSDLKIREYDSAVVLTPYFMRRPLEAMIIPKDTSRNNLHTAWDRKWCRDFGRATADIAFALSEIMPEIGKEFAYNFVFHTGPVGTMYIEVLPYTQEEGGFEKAGLSVCQSSPNLSTELYKRFFEEKHFRKHSTSVFCRV